MTDTLPPQLHSTASEALAPDTAQRDAFGELVTTSRQRWESAVDATDIAVMLEIGGVNDMIAIGTYGARDVQDLAERLLQAVPTRSAALVLAPAPHIDGARLLRRGILYAAPGAFYVAIAADFRSGWAGLALIGTTAAGWMASQVIGFIAYRFTERTGGANTHAVLRRAMVLVLPIALALALVSERAVGPAAATVLAAQVVFAAAAAVLLFYDADRVLAYCVIPGATVAVACAPDWGDAVPPWLPPLLAMTAAVCTALATARTAWTVRSAAARPLRHPSARELAGALPYVLYGLLCATALAFRPLLEMAAPAEGQPSPGPALTVLPIVLVMGYGELEIRRLRGSCQRSASISTTMRHYRRRACADLARLEMRMTAALVISTVVTTAALWAASGRGSIAPAEILRSTATVALGCALVTGLVGCSFARAVRTAAAFLTAFGVAGAAGLAVATLDPSGPVGYLVACLLLLAAVNVAAVSVVRNPVVVIG